MNGIENAQHDISDATFSVDTAIDILAGLEREGSPEAAELARVLSTLRQLKGGLEQSYATLTRINRKDH